MIAITHLTIGATIGAATYRVFKPTKVVGIVFATLFALAIGIGSHFILDSIPHSEYGNLSRGPLSIVLLVELSLVAYLIYFFGIKRLKSENKREAVVIIGGMIGGALPDISYVIYDLLGIKWQFLQSTIKINLYFHNITHIPGLIGLPTQILVSSVALYFLYSLVAKNTKSQNR